MSAGPLRDVLTLLLGFVTGVLSGVFGVGGAVVSTPGIRLLGASAKLAIGSTLPSVLPSSIAGTLRYHREGMVEWRAVAWVTPLGIAASVGGAFLTDVLPGNGHLLQIFTALLLATNAVRLLRERPLSMRVVEHPAPPYRARLLMIGILSGGLSGLLGIGGGVVMVPAFSQWARLSLKRSIATSLACVGLFAIPGTITHAALGNIDWHFALLLSAAVVPGARIGSAFAVKATDTRLRTSVGLFLGLVAIAFAVGETIALVRS